MLHRAKSIGVPEINTHTALAAIVRIFISAALLVVWKIVHILRGIALVLGSFSRVVELLLAALRTKEIISPLVVAGTGGLFPRDIHVANRIFGHLHHPLPTQTDIQSAFPLRVTITL